jgi:3-oxoadipate enol-lactonase
MSFLDLDDGRIHYEMAGPTSAPTLLFSNSLGTSLAMWEPQANALMQDYCILRYDTRGHGRSSVSPGPYRISQLADDVVVLLDRLGLQRVHFCGLSMGGMIGMLLAARAPERLEKLVLCNTAPQIGSAEVWNTRIETVRKGGMGAVVDGILGRWFTAGFRAASPAAIEHTRRMLMETQVEGYSACCAAVRDMDGRDLVASIRVPTLIISGAEDPVATPEEGRLMAERIAGAEYKELAAAHLSNIEAASAFTIELSRFLKA